MSDSLVLKIITTKKSYEVEAEMVLLPSYNGQIGILAHHIPLITELTKGIIKVNFLDKKYKYFIFNGIAEIIEGYVNVISDFAIELTEINKNDILNEITKHEIFINNNPNSSLVSLTMVNLVHYKALLEHINN